MKICIIMSFNLPPEDGIGSYVYNMSKELIRNGHDVTVVTRGGNKVEELKIESINVIKLPFYLLYPFQVYVHGHYLSKYIKKYEYQFDIIHYHTPLPPPVQTNKPIITTVHTTLKRDYKMMELIDLTSLAVKMQGPISYSLEKKLFHISDKITCVSRSVERELPDYDVDISKVDVIGNGVNEKIFYPIKNKSSDKYILYVGRLGYRKGCLDFIKAALTVCDIYSDVNFKIVGKGPQYKMLLNIVNNSKHSDRFVFLGYVEKNKLVQIYQNSTIFVMPSHYEGLPTTLLEAMSCGLPVIATAIDGNLEVIEDNKNGLLIPPKATEIMANKMIELLNDPDYRNRLGVAARETILNRYTWKHIHDNIIKCYNEII